MRTISGSIALGGGTVAAVRTVGLAWLEARPSVQIMFQLRFLAGAVLAGSAAGASASPAVAVAAAAWLCVTWSVYLLNGTSDVVEDRANGSTRPIASGRLAIAVAHRLVLALAIAGMGLAAMVSLTIAALAAAMLLLGWLYSAAPHPQKAQMLGFATVVTCGGLLTYLAAADAATEADGPALGPHLVVFAIAMSLWMSVGGMTKDLSDVEGDSLAGRRTWPVLLGERRARWLMAVTAVGVGVGFFVAARLAAPSVAPASLLVLAGACCVAVCAVTSLSRGARRRQRRVYRAFMITQYAAHLTVLSACLYS